MPFRTPAWQVEAACRDLDTDIFFPDNEAGAAPALEVCASCPVRQACLEFALTTRQHDGVWGGMTESERRRHQRRVGRTAA